MRSKMLGYGSEANGHDLSLDVVVGHVFYTPRRWALSALPRDATCVNAQGLMTDAERSAPVPQATRELNGS
jgi:hypothetical protein